jgi:hypothetical protein
MGKPLSSVKPLGIKPKNTSMGKGSASEQYPTIKNKSPSVTLGNNKGPIGSNPWDNIPRGEANNFNG